MEAEVAVVTVAFPGQGHLNQMLQFSSCLISSHGIPVHYVGSALDNRQARARVNALNPQDVAKIHFHDVPAPPLASPPPNPNAKNKFPSHLYPAWKAVLNLRQPVGAYLHDLAGKFRRVVVVHDPMMAFVVQDVASILNAESYAFHCISAFSQVSFIWDFQGKPFPVEHPKELLFSLQDLKLDDGDDDDKVTYLGVANSESLNYRAGDIYNTCRLIEGPYVEVLEREEVLQNRKLWAIGPVLPTPTKLSSDNKHQCLEWLDKQEPKSVIYVSFGTTVSLSDDEITELASGLERSKVKFLWVLRDADKCNVFDGHVRRGELPPGFEERVEGVGMVVRDWVPQPQILAHSSTGGFMSHCGWNSCMESISLGVPLAAWPMHSDQPRNTALITDVLKTGLVVREWTQRMELVKASTVENAVRRLMASQEGDEIRRTAEELSATLREATRPGGASQLELDSFIAHITR
ncbi:hypothetical protein ACS0TY_031737 [Phlomoides rotata]